MEMSRNYRSGTFQGNEVDGGDVDGGGDGGDVQREPEQYDDDYQNYDEKNPEAEEQVPVVIRVTRILRS
jgi:hypothetical protein